MKPPYPGAVPRSVVRAVRPSTSSCRACLSEAAALAVVLAATAGYVAFRDCDGSLDPGRLTRLLVPVRT